MACKIGSFVMGIAATNCYYLYDEEQKEALVFDPPCNGEIIHKRLSEKGLSVCAILITHGHFDHISGVSGLKKASAAPVYAPAEEKELLCDPALNLSDEGVCVRADHSVIDGEELSLGGFHLRVISTPGHTSGGCCYYFPDEKILISGDTLFAQSVGRTDLPTGSSSTLIRSIREKLMPLPDDVAVYPGHGESTTIGYERKYNPFI
jgi:glyoxylase-like metal-dependent hydrolase (beta-lactamase superfamily II)